MSAVREIEPDDLFAAFEAGFAASGEGYNGEYVGPRLQERGVLRSELWTWFTKWLDTPDA